MGRKEPGNVFSGMAKGLDAENRRAEADDLGENALNEGDAVAEPEVDAEILETVEAVEEEEASTPKKARKPRKSRKKAEASKMTESDELEVAPAVVEAPVAPVAFAVEPDPVKPPDAEPVAVASASMQQSMDAMVKQWSNIRDISQAVTANFERVNALLQELPAKYAEIEKDLKPPMLKPAFITKVATAVSAVAIVFSLLSLSLSQSARQAVLTNEAVASVHPSSSLAALDAPRRPVTVKKPREVPHAPKAKNHL